MIDVKTSADLKLSTIFIHPVRADVDDQLAYVLNFYQIGQETIPNIIMANLIRALCGYIYFTELRIKEQLGYTTKGKVFSEGNVIYYN